MRGIRAGLTLEQIAQVTGYSMGNLRTQEKYFSGRDKAIADNVFLTMNGGRA